jgi:hypothetical protein
VTTSHGGRPGLRAEDDGSTVGTDGDASGPTCQYSTGAGSLLLTLVVLLVTYPTLRALVAPLQALSSTAIVALVIGVWAVTWLVFELAWTYAAA